MSQACDICGEQPAAFIITLIETGDTNYQCPGCYARLGLEAAKTILPPEEIASQLGPMFVEGGGQPGNGKRARRRAQEPPEEAAEPGAGPEAPEGLEEPPAASQDG